MKKYLTLLAASVLMFGVIGCKKKEEEAAPAEGTTQSNEAPATGGESKPAEEPKAEEKKSEESAPTEAKPEEKPAEQAPATEEKK